MPLEHVKLIIREHSTSSCADYMEVLLMERHKIHIPHNRIHMVLKHAGCAQDDPKKQKRRKWVRYEREHSLSLVHADWHESKVVPGKWVIAYEDDASRMVLAMDEYDNANAENSVKTLQKAVQFAKPYGGMEQVLTDHGCQFQTKFDEVLKAHNIEHILSRVNHPQTNGKIERFFQTYNKKRSRFKTVAEFVKWYNEVKMHGSLNRRHAETPSHAFIQKLEPAIWLGWVKEWF